MEVLLSISILSSGMVLILPAFIQCAGALESLDDRYQSVRVANKILVEKEEEWRKSGAISSLRQGEMGNFPVFLYQINDKAVPGNERLCDLSVQIEWEGARRGRLIKTAVLSR